LGSHVLYGQVDKAFHDEPIGEEARFKNAKLSFYMGDFDWSQTVGCAQERYHGISGE
jgi:hypothetical protein